MSELRLDPGHGKCTTHHTGKDPGRAQPLVQGAVKPSRKVVLGKENELRVVRHAHETDNCEI